MSEIKGWQSDVIAALNEFGTKIKILKNSGDDTGRSKLTVGLLTVTTTDDIADAQITLTDKIVIMPGNLGFNLSAGDSVTFIGSKKTYTVVKTVVYNINDVVADNIAMKIYVRP